MRGASCGKQAYNSRKFSPGRARRFKKAEENSTCRRTKGELKVKSRARHFFAVWIFFSVPVIHSLATMGRPLSRGGLLPKNSMRLQASHPEPHRFVELSTCLPAARERRADGTGPTALTEVGATFTSTNCGAAILRITFSATAAMGQRPTRSRSGKWRRPQCPGNRFALARVSECPWQFTLGNCQLPPASPQIVVRQALRDPTFSLNPLCGRMSRPAIENFRWLVQKLWTIVLPCGNLRKILPDLRPRKCIACKLQ